MPEQTVMSIVRVAVLADGKLTDVALPTELPLREIIPAVTRLLVSEDDTTATQQVTLAPIGGAPFSVDATLDRVGVADGDLLALQPVSAGPAAAGIVEDIADAAVIFSSSRQKPWGATQIRRGARLALMALVIALTALGVLDRATSGSPLGLYVVCALAVVTMVAALLLGRNAPGAATELSIVALFPVAAALAMVIPGNSLAAQVLLAAAGVTAWSLICLLVADRATAFFTTSAVTGGGVLLAAAAAALWEPSWVILGCGLIVLALLITVQAAQLSALWARFPLPVIPAPGDPTPSAPSVRVLRDLPRRVRASESHQTGLIAAAVLLAIAGSLAIVASVPTNWVGWYVVVATAAAATLRARVWDSPACKGWLLAHPFLLAISVGVAFVIGGRYDAAWWAVVVLAVLTAAFVVIALNPQIGSAETYSLPMRRLLGFVALAIDASLIPVMAYLVGIFTWVLNR